MSHWIIALQFVLAVIKVDLFKVCAPVEVQCSIASVTWVAITQFMSVIKACLDLGIFSGIDFNEDMRSEIRSVTFIGYWARSAHLLPLNSYMKMFDLQYFTSVSHKAGLDCSNETSGTGQ